MNEMLEHLVNYNTVIIKDQQELSQLWSVVEPLGMITRKNDNFEEIVKLLKFNHPEIDINDGVIIEFSKGDWTIGWSMEESTNWYGIKPYTLDEFLKEIKKTISRF